MINRDDRVSGTAASTASTDEAHCTGRRVVLASAILLFVITRAYLLCFFRAELSELNGPIFEYGVKGVDFHIIPYSEDLPIEYPPLSWWTIRTARLLEQPPVDDVDNRPQVDAALTAFRRDFRVLMSLADLVSFFLWLLIVQRRRPQWIGWAALSYVIVTAGLGHVLYDRLDVGLLMLLLAWAYCWLLAIESPKGSIGWSTGAYLALGLAISYKFVPVIMVPFLLLSQWRLSRRNLLLPLGVGALAVGSGLPFLIQYISSGPGVFGFLTYHAQREIQVESLYSTLMMIGAAFGAPAQMAHGHGGFNIVGAWESAMMWLAFAAILGFLAVLCVWALARGPRYCGHDAYRLACYVVGAAIIFSKVLSPQYFVWAIPFLILTAVEVLPERIGWRWMLLVALVAIVALTTWIFPYHYERTADKPLGLVSWTLAVDSSLPQRMTQEILGARNFLYLAVVIWLGVRTLAAKTADGCSNAQMP